MTKQRRWPWVAQQNWEDILFVHTPVTYESIRPYVPYPFEIDLYENQAWISIIVFRASNSRLRLMPSWMGFPSFYQMNFRTYVRFGNERGVYFFKIHANSPLVKISGRVAGLPVAQAHMGIEETNDTFIYRANQLWNDPQRKLALSYQPTTKPINMHKDLLPHFLAERYAIWMIRDNTILKAPITHTNWSLRQADISVLESTYMPFSITDASIAHYAEFKHCRLHPFERVGLVSEP